jgi:hypothetical protein
MSSLEFCAKKFIHQGPRLTGFRGRVHLKEIMYKSKEKSAISEEAFKRWTGIIHLRNSIAHNNAISEETECYEYPSVSLTVEDGKMARGNLKTFPFLNLWIIEEAKNWFIALK